MVEELEPYIQRQVESLGIECIGDQVFGKAGELSANHGKAGSRGRGCADSADVKDLPPRSAAMSRWMSVHAAGQAGF